MHHTPYPESNLFRAATIINLSSRTHMSQSPFSLDLIKFFSALTAHNVDMSLPWLYSLLVIIFVTITLLPGALWAGALTPVNTLKPSTGQLLLPGWRNTTALQNNYHSNLRNLYQLHTAEGLFSYKPEFDLQGTILGLAAQASNPGPHAKLDKTGYLYDARSSGVGASVGLMDQAFSNNTKSYNFTELGLQSHTSCIYNDTADFSVGDDLLPDDDGWLYSLFDTSGSLPVAGESVNVGATAFGYGPGQIVTLFTATSGSHNTLGIFAGEGSGEGQYYGPLNNVQCDIKFSPTVFSLSVDRTNRTISIFPVGDVDMPPYGQLVINRTLGAMSTMSSVLTTAYVPMLGQALMHNIANVPVSPGKNSTSNLLGVTDAVDSFIDNILLSYASAELMITKDSVPSNITSEETAIVFGKPVYIYLIFTTNLIIFLVYLAEALRTRGWHDLTTFNYMDVKTVIVGASMGGTGIADEVNTLHEQKGSTWRAEAKDRIAGQVHAQLDRTSQGATAIVVSNVDIRTSSQRRRPTLGRLTDSATGILLQHIGEISTLPRRLSHEERRASLGSWNVESSGRHEDLTGG